jgi:magnesium transporter
MGESVGGKITSIANGGTRWVDVTDPGPTEMAALSRDFHFHPLDLDACISTLHLTKMEDHDDYFFITLQVPDQADSGAIVSNQLVVFLGADYIVTVHSSRLKTLSALFQSCKDDEKQRAALMKYSAYLAYQIIDRLVDGIFTILNSVQTSLDSIENVVFDEKKSSARPINAARRQIAILRRILYPLGLYIPDIEKAQKFSKEDLAIYFSDVRHKVGKLTATVEEMKEMVEIYNDTDFTISSDQTNSILSFLTIIFTLTLPAAVIAAFYGMNIPIPGAISPGAWGSPLGPYTSLIFILVLILVPTLAMASYFRHKGWF